MKRLLLHTCCAPCGTSVFETLLNEKEYEVTSFYCNPNIKPREEWSKRLAELEKLVDFMKSEPLRHACACHLPLTGEDDTLILNPPLLRGGADEVGGGVRFSVDLVVSGYNQNEFDKVARGLEDEAEGGRRCEKCFRLRLLRTAEHAKANGFEAFGTTLTVSPHKNADLINRIGREVSAIVGIEFLERDFKKGDGYKRSIELCREHGIYRQNYCGCIFA